MSKKLKVLVIGGGGREHALAWAIAKSARVEKIVCAPGNGGIAEVARCVPVDVTNLNAMLEVVAAEQPDLTVVGPEVPLALGLVDALESRGLRVFGPTRRAAELESSKAFAKEFMRRNGIPTAAYSICASLSEVLEELQTFSLPVVVKADGLAAGKGVVICTTRQQAEAAAAEMFSGALLGSAVGQVVLEEFLAGEELSFFALCDGKHAVALAGAQDHKRVGEGDTGLNTGGMGAYSTDALLPDALRDWLTRNVAQRVVDGMAAERAPFKGILFCGIMLVPHQDGTVHPMVLEFNTRFGDPETQALMMRLETDVMDIFDAAIDGTAGRLAVKMKPGASVCVIVASGGYPGKYASGKVIAGLHGAAQSEDVMVFHSGTAIRGGEFVTAGGRVLGITAAAADLQSALDRAYARLAQISFDDMQYRRDIGWRALQVKPALKEHARQGKIARVV
jgi:phosphoribosylamine---glycine ligase